MLLWGVIGLLIIHRIGGSTNQDVSIGELCQKWVSGILDQQYSFWIEDVYIIKIDHQHTVVKLVQQSWVYGTVKRYGSVLVLLHDTRNQRLSACLSWNYSMVWTQNVPYNRLFKYNLWNTNILRNTSIALFDYAWRKIAHYGICCPYLQDSIWKQEFFEAVF